MSNLREAAEEMAREREESRAKWSRYLDGAQWPETLLAPARWIGKNEALAMYPKDNSK